MKGMTLMLIVMLASFVVAGLWNQDIIKNSVHFVLDPSAGSLMNFNPTLGMIIIVFLITLITTIVQKYGTDQAALKQIKNEQKKMQEEAKKYKSDPGKMMEFNKKQFEHMPKMFEMTMKPLVYTMVPFILFFRWFNDYFLINIVKFLGFFSWFWFYLILSLIGSSIWRKILKVV